MGLCTSISSFFNDSGYKCLDFLDRERGGQELGHGEKDGVAVLEARLRKRRALKPTAPAPPPDTSLEQNAKRVPGCRRRDRVKRPSRGLGCLLRSQPASAHWMPGGEGHRIYTSEIRRGASVDNYSRRRFREERSSIPSPSWGLRFMDMLESGEAWRRGKGEP